MSSRFSPHARPRVAAPPDDETLLRAVAAGDLGGLGELYDRYHGDVRRAVQRTLPGSADVDDVVHAVFLELPRLAARFEGSTCRAWLCGIAVRLSLRHQRGLGRLLRTLMTGNALRPSRVPSDPERLAMGNQELAVLTRALARIAPKKRAAFVLVEIEGLSANEAAAALEIAPATLRTRLFHAKRELRAALERSRAW